MSIEIERKFLVSGEFKKLVINYFEIKQGYIFASDKKSVRVRLKASKAFLTIKGNSSKNGISRYEWEKEITIKEAEELFLLCSKKIEKIRYEVPFQGHTFEVDEFLGDNKGLVIAEVELKNEDEKVILPSFIGKEVSGDIRYYNSELINNPYKNWTEK